MMEGDEPLRQKLQLVKIGLERCIQNHMSKKEAIKTLNIEGNIEPQFTKLVWERLEKDNPEFFEAYNIELLVKDQIQEFNRLLAEQADLMHQIGLIGHTTNASDLLSTPSVAQSSKCLRAGEMEWLGEHHQNGSSSQTSAQGTSFDEPVHSSINYVSQCMLSSQTSENRLIVKAETSDDARRSPFSLFPFSNFIGTCPLMADATANPLHQNHSPLSSNACLVEENHHVVVPAIPYDLSGNTEKLNPEFKSLRNPSPDTD